MSGDLSGPRACDIYAIAAEFPDRWSRLMAELYRSDVALIMLTFAVSERTARKWVRGEGGVNSRHSTLAQLEAPAAYRRIILDEAA